MSDSVIVSAVRLPTGKFLGALKDLSAPELGGLVVKEVVTRAGIDPTIVNECIMGNVVSAGLGQNPARQAALNGGLPAQVGAVTINEVCGSGLKAVMLATQGIAAGDIEVAVAGGMESMSRAPYLLDRMREGLRLGNGLLLDAMVHDGLWCAHENWHMGMTGEVVAETYGVTREEQDAYAVESHHRAAEATRRGWFADEILPVKVSQKKGPATIFDHDESVREDTSRQSLMKLQPAFKPDGTVTAGNAPGVNDGAAAVVVMSSDRATSLGLTPLARIVGQATSGVSPRLVMMAPVDAIRKLIDKVGWTLDSVDLFELNEAFSVQAVAVTRELGISPTRVNVHGGAVALGHPIGASGARILTTLLYAMRQRNAARGIAALCLGGGNGVTLAVERK
ncbi:MAG TPA: acetyl-CoA C-acyltransferase [Acidobacteria bacterium]|jgi:acetyl-CoA C-acetyltransferase|nr:acetyl-CoA C-acyltransferase [Acidobacteriota bacterium]